MATRNERSCSGGRVRAIAVWLWCLASVSAAGASTCEGLSPASANFVNLGVDHLPRLDFHDGVSGPEACRLPLPEPPSETLDLSLYAHNLHGAITGCRLRIVGTAEILDFLPAAGVVGSGGWPHADSAGTWFLDLVLQVADLCGPVMLGRARVRLAAAEAGFFVDIAGHAGLGPPVIVRVDGTELPVVTPRHGVSIGLPDRFHCQPPICPEPNGPVSKMRPLQTGGRVIELGWVAGGGNFTMIRCRNDGVHPTSVHDGQLMALVPTHPGTACAVIHESPDSPQYWYAAFSVTIAGGLMIKGGQLECGSFTTATVDVGIPVQRLSWSALKHQYR